ncbi:MAG: DUF1566 domain-containing protein [Rhodospirillales bacterium]|nr:DUF1566 domain-containing protein [Rhodospirillales bacterium]
MPTSAYAACSNPAGSEGDLIYNDDENVLQFCDGTNWNGLNGGASGNGGCVNPARYEGAVVYNADFNVPQVCSGDTWVALGKDNAGAGSGGCSNPADDEGAIVYNDDFNVMQYCDGDTWRRLYGGGSAICNTVGQVCADGTVYAGLSGASTPMFVTRCDAGMSWTGSCTGTRSTMPWNNGNSTGYVTTGITGTTDGQGNTAALVAADSDSVVGGQQPHQAAQYCNDLVANGYSDWYLPAKNELNTLYVNETAIGGFETSGSYYWSSTEFNLDNAWRQRFSDGYQGTHGKNGTLAVRCARR